MCLGTSIGFKEHWLETHKTRQSHKPVTERLKYAYWKERYVNIVNDDTLIADTNIVNLIQTILIFLLLIKGNQYE